MTIFGNRLQITLGAIVASVGKSLVRVPAVDWHATTAHCAVLTAGIAQQPGALDTSFGGDGRVVTDFGGEESAFAVALQQDGRIVAGGQFGDPTRGTLHFGLARYRRNGQLDPTFGGDGRVTLGFPGPNSRRAGQVQAVVVQPDGRILAGGFFASFGFALARFRPNGSLDTSFSGDGVATTNRLNASGISAIALQPNGKIVAAGSAFDGTGRLDFALARFLPNGKLDQSFGDGGDRHHGLRRPERPRLHSCFNPTAKSSLLGAALMPNPAAIGIRSRPLSSQRQSGSDLRDQRSADDLRGDRLLRDRRGASIRRQDRRSRPTPGASRGLRLGALPRKRHSRPVF